MIILLQNIAIQVRMGKGVSCVSELQVGPRWDAHVDQLVVDAAAQERGQRF